MADDLAKPRRTKQNAKIRSALADRLSEFTDQINAQSEASTAPRADVHGQAHPDDVHVRMPNTHEELQDHLMEHHYMDEESAETWTPAALIGIHNEAHADPHDAAVARQHQEGWHFHARPMRGV